MLPKFALWHATCLKLIQSSLPLGLEETLQRQGSYFMERLRQLSRKRIIKVWSIILYELFDVASRLVYLAGNTLGIILFSDNSAFLRGIVVLYP